jgi:hypothetical protein
MNEVRGVRVVLESLDTILAEQQPSGTTHLLALEEVMKGNRLLNQCSEELEKLKKALEPKARLASPKVAADRKRCRQDALRPTGAERVVRARSCRGSYVSKPFLRAPMGRDLPTNYLVPRRLL